MASSRRLHFGIDDSGHLTIEPLVRKCVSLRLRTEGVDVHYRTARPALLPWNAYEGSSGGAQPLPDSWVITHWAVGRATDVFGVALLVRGQYDEECDELLSKTSTPWRKYVQWFASGFAPGRRLPVVATHSIFTRCPEARATLSALALVLMRRPELREMLGNRERMARLADDLPKGLVGSALDRSGKWRDEIDILTAMRGAGFRHALGRPIKGEPLPSVDTVVARTRTLLDASPYRAGRHTSDAKITWVVRAGYLDIEPWPFAALVA